MPADRDPEAVRRVRVGDIDVSFRLEGAEGAPVVMLVHGLLASHRIWDGVVASLRPAWRVLRFDLRGHGGSTATVGAYTMHQLACDAVGLMDALDIASAHFVGLSLGGMLGQYLGAYHPSRFPTLTLANTACQQSQPATWQERIDAAALRGLEPLIPGSLQRWFTPRVSSEQPALLAEADAIARGTSVRGFIGCASVVRDLSQCELLAAIALPTLVIGGALDQATTVAEAEVIAHHIHGARLETLEAAHQSAMECPDAFSRAWTQFQRTSNLPRSSK